jgi:hypothetical protein
LPFSGWVNLGIIVVPLCSFGSRQCAEDRDWLASSPTMLNARRWQLQQFPKHKEIFIELCGLTPKDNPVQ